MIASARQLRAIFTALYPDFTASFKHEAAHRYRRNSWPYCALLGSEHRRRTKEKKPTLSVTRQTAPATAEMKLFATRKMLIERKRASREHLRNSLSLYEELLQKQTADYELKKGLYQWDLISKVELENSERAMSSTRLEIEQIRQWIGEDDVALLLTEEAAQEELARLPPLPLGGYDETATLIRYNGAANWSLAGV